MKITDKKAILLVLPLMFVLWATVNLPGQSARAARRALAERQAELAEKYRQWLEVVTHISSEQEREIFLMLENDRDRDMFIDLFWKVRDPTPGTVENEFREEHLKRIAYADHHFGRGTARPGSQTDMGRIHIILGEPSSITREEFSSEIHPMQIWSYYGDVSQGFPSHFWVVFFKRGGAGEYKLYNPALDGPDALLRDRSSVELGNLEGVYARIHEIDPILAQAAFSLIPDEGVSNFRPSVASANLLNQVIELPRRRVKAAYATDFMKFKGLVKVDYATNYLESRNEVQVFHDAASGLDFVHLAMQPQRVSVDYSRDRDEHFFNYNLHVSLRRGEDAVFEYNKAFTVYAREQEMLAGFGSGVIVADYFPVAAGEYRLMVMLENSVLKEFSYFEQAIAIKPRDTALPQLVGPLLSHKVAEVKRYAILPYKFNDIEMVPAPGEEFGRGESVHVVIPVDRRAYDQELSLEIEIEGRHNPEKRRFVLPKNRRTDVFHYRLADLDPGFYTLRARLLSPSGAVLDSGRRDFSVTLQDQPARPGVASRHASLDNRHFFKQIVAGQYDRTGRSQQARELYDRALRAGPENYALVRDFADFLLRQEDFSAALDVIEKLRDAPDQAFNYHALSGKAAFLQKNHRLCLEHLLQAVKIYDSEVEVLNMLALSYLQTGDQKEAVRILRASLNINAAQPEIIRLLEEIK